MNVSQRDFEACHHCLSACVDTGLPLLPAEYDRMSGMGGLKKIMYGVTDFPRMRKENAYFVDRTALIPELEKTPYALLFVGHGPYLVRHELDANGGYTDIAFNPQLDRWPQIGHAALIELKYFKAEEKVTRQKLAALKAAKRK